MNRMYEMMMPVYNRMFPDHPMNNCVEILSDLEGNIGAKDINEKRSRALTIAKLLGWKGKEAPPIMCMGDTQDRGVNDFASLRLANSAKYKLSGNREYTKFLVLNLADKTFVNEFVDKNKTKYWCPATSKPLAFIKTNLATPAFLKSFPEFSDEFKYLFPKEERASFDENTLKTNGEWDSAKLKPFLDKFSVEVFESWAKHIYKKGLDFHSKQILVHKWQLGSTMGASLAFENRRQELCSMKGKPFEQLSFNAQEQLVVRSYFEEVQTDNELDFLDDKKLMPPVKDVLTTREDSKRKGGRQYLLNDDDRGGMRRYVEDSKLIIHEEKFCASHSVINPDAVGYLQNGTKLERKAKETDKAYFDRWSDARNKEIQTNLADFEENIFNRIEADLPFAEEYELEGCKNPHPLVVSALPAAKFTSAYDAQSTKYNIISFNENQYVCADKCGGYSVTEGEKKLREVRETYLPGETVITGHLPQDTEIIVVQRDVGAKGQKEPAILAKVDIATGGQINAKFRNEKTATFINPTTGQLVCTDSESFILDTRNKLTGLKVGRDSRIAGCDFKDPTKYVIQSQNYLALFFGYANSVQAGTEPTLKVVSKEDALKEVKAYSQLRTTLNQDEVYIRASKLREAIADVYEKQRGYTLGYFSKVITGYNFAGSAFMQKLFDFSKDPNAVDKEMLKSKSQQGPVMASTDKNANENSKSEAPSSKVLFNNAVHDDYLIPLSAIRPLLADREYELGATGSDRFAQYLDKHAESLFKTRGDHELDREAEKRAEPGGKI